MDEEKKSYQHLFPAQVLVEEGQRYLWCGCGKSQTQPLCDGAGECGGAVEFIAELTNEVYFCNCKQTLNPPWCDGSHAKLLMEAIKQKKADSIGKTNS